MVLRGVALSICLAAAGAAPAVAQWSPTHDLAKTEGGHFTLDKSHGRIVFSTTHFGISTYYAFFNDIDATLDFDPKAPAKSALEVTVNLNGIVASDRELEDKLKSADFFEVARFPAATFKSTKIEVSGAKGKITGDLTLHGVTKPVVLDVTFNGGGANPFTNTYVVGFNATGRLNRSDFGMGTFVPIVGDQITLTISCEFNRPQ